MERALPSVKRWAQGRLPRYARSDADTEDVVQDACLATFRNLKRFRHYSVGAIRRTDRHPARQWRLSAIAEAGHCRLVSRNGHGVAARRSVTRHSLMSLLRSLWPDLVLLLLFFLFMFRHLLLLVFFLVFLAAPVSHDFSFGPRLILQFIKANAVERGLSRLD
jgi:Sigma-70 region 2